ncbi:hypothetical protein BDV95DRAFT_631235 [Massariosphaeria phaeospora]|uniref:DUF1772-domain-containing protein n=1 Tax=Massariosphaeria phaeospora TaxID=100035 RepID=A0A7C8M6E2_9PLEO|nr:hypothetical protein BDV95DRAFT_631235 [Massariosphaeria phaeospora]
MLAFPSTSTSPAYALPMRVAQVIGITAPVIYSSFAFAYSHMVMPPIVAHAPEKVLAKQWLHAYQAAPTFVPPLVLSGTVANVLLAYLSPTIPFRLLYGAAAVLTWSIIPVTLFYFEPNINGAGKWKVEEILREEGHRMKEQQGALPSPHVHTGTPEARRWAETVGMRDIALKWTEVNKARYVITAIASIASAAATCSWTDTLI